MGLLDILIVGALLVFIVTRFIKFDLPKDERTPEQKKADDWRSLLRRDSPAGRPGAAEEGPVVDVTPRRRPTSKPVDLTGLSGLEQIKALDPAFQEKAFVDGALNAYRYFYDRWNHADEDGLANLCAPGLLNQLISQLDAYAARGEQPQVLLAPDTLPQAEIAEARLNGRTAVVEVDIHARQAVDGGPMHDVRSRWTLARPLNSEDPNWELQNMLELGGTA